MHIALSTVRDRACFLGQIPLLINCSGALMNNLSDQSCSVSIAATADLPSRFGSFKMVGFRLQGAAEEEAVALVSGDVSQCENVLVRMHSECLTGDALGSMRCDCRDQLQAALSRIGGAGCGVLLYLRQEGRGIGLLNKVRAYSLQDDGLDTVDANLALGLPEDGRDYESAARMLDALGVKSVRLLTNNPDKVSQLEAHGVEVVERVPHVMEVHHHNAEYLKTKARRQGHYIAVDEVAAK